MLRMDREPGDHDDVVTIRGVPWSQFVALAKLDLAGPRLAYLDGVLQLVSPGHYHEGCKTLLARLVECYVEERGGVLDGYGAETYKKRKDQAGVEPDECYFVSLKRGKFPDLAIEVVSTHESIDKLEIYRRLGVREVWFWDEGEIAIYQLVKRSYRLATRSRVLRGLDIADLARRVRQAGGQTAAVRRYRRWLKRRRSPRRARRG
jgi:Uma2 family endonuclease